MSGGLAFVYDRDGSFSTRCNPGMVELEGLSARDEAMLQTLIQRHQQYTGSAVAERLLADWANTRARFVKVMPTEYRKIVEAQHLSAEAEDLAAV
jgi:glutamate synthase domain-containing protein 3